MSEGAAWGPDALVDWIGRRQPTPPPDLRERLDAELRSVAARGRSAPPARSGEGRPLSGPRTELPKGPGEALLAAARRRLDAAMARPGRIRDTAFELLVADALVTYACEAALEEERPEEALRRILEG